MKRRAARQTRQATGTALSKYQRLESDGLWRDSPEGQRREVVVRMGEATLMLTDPRSELVLSHWSLPAVHRVNPGQRPALYTPGDQDDVLETLEITDDHMIAALKTVSTAVKAAKPHPGRLRGLLVGGAVAVVVGIAVLVVPGVLVSHTAAVVPPAKRAEIGMRALDDVTRLTGAPCDNVMGLAPLADLSERVFGPTDTPLLYILPEGLTRPAHLPGGVILLPRSLIETDSPDALAGAALAERVASEQQDPILDILDHAGFKSSFDLLTSGDLPDGALNGYGEIFLRESPVSVSDKVLLTAFEKAQVPATPYARWLDPSGQKTQSLIDGDPYRGLISSPLLPDDDWIALQSVCSG